MLLCSREEITVLTLAVVAETGKVFLVAETFPIYVHEGFFVCLAVHSHFMERRGIFHHEGSIMVGCNQIFEGMNH